MLPCNRLSQSFHLVIETLNVGAHGLEHALLCLVLVVKDALLLQVLLVYGILHLLLLAKEHLLQVCISLKISHS